MAECPCVVPDKFPISCVMELIRIARNPVGDGSQLGELLCHGGCVSLAISGMVGHEDGHPPLWGSLPPMDLTQTADYIESEMSAPETFAATPEAIDPAVIMAIVQLIMQLWELFRPKAE